MSNNYLDIIRMERESVEKAEADRLMSEIQVMGIRGEREMLRKGVGGRWLRKSQKPHKSTRLLILVA